MATETGGLSPRPRGSLGRSLLCFDKRGSIPASAGEPGHRRRHALRRGVYPRVRGGAEVEALGVVCGEGLSPRPRGSRGLVINLFKLAGSIPASAGEPGRIGGCACRDAVYPRVRGGALRRRGRSADSEGLSPRPRGSPLYSGVSLPSAGSIPASAGEPPSCRAAATRSRVYPRVRGGAATR